VTLPHRIATLLYVFDEGDRVLLIERNHEPNKGYFSPPGGKLHTDSGESPHACAIREAKEETGIQLTSEDLHLTGIISEQGYQNNTHWLMFLFEIKKCLTELPPEHEEGAFRWASLKELQELPLPGTDREKIWPLFWEHRGGFFVANCQCTKDQPDEWTLLQSNPTLP
jgi:8-oxo-dGTP diphosphatase